MKLSEVNVIVGILAGMKINRIADKKIKTALLNDYLHLRPHFKKANEDVEEIRRKFQEDWNDELDAVQAFRDKSKPVVGHDAYLEAEKDANKAISDTLSAEVEVDIKSVPMDDFMVACGGEELTIEQLAFLQEAGIVE
jgi:hypothetical protein